MPTTKKEVVLTTVLTRDELRAKLLSSKKFKSEIIQIFGEDVEVRQPNMGQILDAQQLEDRKEAFIKSIQIL